MLKNQIHLYRQAAVGYMGEINASAKNDIVKDFRNRNDEMLAKTVKVLIIPYIQIAPAPKSLAV